MVLLKLIFGSNNDLKLVFALRTFANELFSTEAKDARALFWTVCKLKAKFKKNFYD